MLLHKLTSEVGETRSLHSNDGVPTAIKVHGLQTDQTKPTRVLLRSLQTKHMAVSQQLDFNILSATQGHLWHRQQSGTLV